MGGLLYGKRSRRRDSPLALTKHTNLSKLETLLNKVRSNRSHDVNKKMKKDGILLKFVEEFSMERKQ